MWGSPVRRYLWLWPGGVHLETGRLSGERSRVPPVRPQELEPGGLREVVLWPQALTVCLGALEVPTPSPTPRACAFSGQGSASCPEHLIRPGLPVPVPQTLQPFLTFRSPSWRFVSLKLLLPWRSGFGGERLHVTRTPCGVLAGLHGLLPSACPTVFPCAPVLPYADLGEASD